MMKTFRMMLAVGLASGLSLGAFNASAELEVSASVHISATAEFHAPLTPHGAWIEIDSHGRCWRPSRIAVGWRPYCDGRWVWTDCGWYWESDEPWAWACYHYGSWMHHPRHGWIWVPGIEWAPAWVSWRMGGGYCGWAPMPPRGVVVAGPAFVFVDVRRFHEPVRPASVIVNNTTIINKTTEIAHAKHATRNIDGAGPKRVLVNEGPGLAPIEKATGKKLRQVSIREASSQTRVPPDVSRQSARPRGKEKPAGEAERSPSAQGRQQPRQDSQPSQGKPDGGPAKEKDKDKGKSKGKGGGKGKP